MDPQDNPFSTPSRTASNSDADELDAAAIGVALTSDERQGPTPGGHRTLPGVSVVTSAPFAASLDVTGRSSSSQILPSPPSYRVTESPRSGQTNRIQETVRQTQNGSETDAREVDDVARTLQTTVTRSGNPFATPLRSTRRVYHRRSTSLASSPAYDTMDVRDTRHARRGSRSVVRSSSSDSTQSDIQDRATAESPPPPHRSRRPPVSMRRVYNASSTDEEAPHDPRHRSFVPHSVRRSGRAPSDSRWPASPLHLRPIPSVSTLPGISIQAPTPPIEVVGDHDGNPGRATTQFTANTLPGDLETPRQPARRTSQSLSRGVSSASSTTHVSWGSDATLLSPTKSDKPRKKSLKVAFAEPSGTGSGHSRNPSMSDASVSDAPGLLHPPKGALPSFKNPFDDSPTRGVEDSEADSTHAEASASRRPSDRRRSSTKRTGFLGRMRPRLHSIGPLDKSDRHNSTSSGSQSSSRKQSVVTSQLNASTGSASPGRANSWWDRRPSFRDPFRRHSQGDVEARLTGGRRASEPQLRRQSVIRRMSSMVVPENPIPPRYRTRSVSSLAYFVAPLEKNNKTIPIFEADIENQKENVEEFLAGVEILQSRSVRKPWQSVVFKIAYFVTILCIVYFVFVGQPLWDGVGLIFYRWINSAGLAKAGSAIFMSWAGFQAFMPLLATRFEQEVDDVEKRDASEVAVVIPAYKAAKILPETIRHALKIFKPEQIFIMANGNSPTPMDDTAEVCAEFGVNVAWVPIGSKITAEFVGVALTSKYKYILLIDDDVHLPANLPIVTDRIQGATKCVGYTIKSTGENGSKGTLVQQCQDMEYKLSGLTRTFCGKFGSATFPHGAIILWERATLQALFNVHPGYAISEDWFFGYAARASGCRIQFCSQVFVETETPPDLFFTSGPARGGFGEMTVFKQRFFRWNFFWSHRLWEDTIYIFCSWRLGWREIVTKLWVTVELYDCVMSFLRPWVIVMALIANYRLLLTFIAALTAMYALAFITFNSWHLRKKKEMIAWHIMPVYMAMKFALMWVNVVSVYYDLYCYAKYFSVKHPRVIETRKVLEAAYKARLGPNLIPLDAQMGDAAAAAEAKAAGSGAGAEMSDNAGVAAPLDGVHPIATAQGVFGGFNSNFSFTKETEKTEETRKGSQQTL